ncbi:MAG: hypothetical protein KDA92_01560 [Planctomycetales bacterium]|nr:hypothetical protein [Planctomycetales bacterium]
MINTLAHLPTSIWWVAGCVMAVVCWWLYPRRRPTKPAAVHDFSEHPARYDQAIIGCIGRIEFVFADGMLEGWRRRLFHITRTFLNNRDQANRHTHQRFLVSSPALRPGQRLLVHHNTSFGKLSLRAGDWISITGTYVHQPQSASRVPGHRHFYGLLHETHPPQGMAQVLRQAPKTSECGIRVISQRAHDRQLSRAG